MSTYQIVIGFLISNSFIRPSIATTFSPRSLQMNPNNVGSRFWRQYPEASYWLAATLIGSLALYFVAKVHQADFLVFLDAGRAVLHGKSPYPLLGSASVYSGSAFVYPYWIAAAFAPLALLGTATATLVFVWGSILAYALTVRLLIGRDLIVLGLLLFASPVLISLQMGTLTPWLALAVALAWRYRDTAILAGVVVAGAATSKLFLFPLVFFFLATRRYRGFAATFAASAAVVGFGFVVGPLDLWGYAHLLVSLAGHESTQSWSALGLGEAYGLGSIAAKYVVAFGSGASLLLLGSRWHSTRDDGAVMAGSIVVSLLATPILWSSYLPMIAVALLVMVPRRGVLAFFAVPSWLLVTVDRGGTAGVVVGVAAVLFVAALALGELFPEAEPASTGLRLLARLRGSPMAQIAWPRFGASSISVGVLVAIGLVLALNAPHFAPAIAVQATLIGLLLGANHLLGSATADASLQESDIGGATSS